MCMHAHTIESFFMKKHNKYYYNITKKGIAMRGIHFDM